VFPANECYHLDSAQAEREERQNYNFIVKVKSRQTNGTPSSTNVLSKRQDGMGLFSLSIYKMENGEWDDMLFFIQNSTQKLETKQKSLHDNMQTENYKSAQTLM